MKIDANDKEIQEIFNAGYFKIPRFQRPYSWGVDEVSLFWDDVVNQKDDHYFIGSMVAYQTEKPYFGIVDGQQRLTTITLLLSAIRNAFWKLGKSDLAHGIHNFIERTNLENKKEFILNPETSYPYLQSHIQSFEKEKVFCEVGLEEKNLESAFNVINQRLVSTIPQLSDDNIQNYDLFDDGLIAVQKLTEIRNKVLSLKLVFIQLDNEDDAYLIFETLNARGKDLSISDLVKNLILKKLQSTNDRFDSAKESWNALVKCFDDSGNSSELNTFLLHFWVSEYFYTTEKQLFTEFKKLINENEVNATKIVFELPNVAKLYLKLLSPTSQLWSNSELEVKRSLEALKLFKVKQQTAMTLALLRAYDRNVISLKNLIKALKKIELFHFCFNAITAQRSSGSISSNYSRLAIELTNSKDKNQSKEILKGLDEFLSKKLPDKKEFILKFSELSFNRTNNADKSLIKYALGLLWPVGHSGIEVEPSSLTIEHLLPQSSSLPLAVVSKVGNLILIDAKTNSEKLCSKSYDEKFTILNDIKYPVEDFLLTDNLDSSLINKRSKDLAEALYALCTKVLKKPKGVSVDKPIQSTLFDC